MQTPLEKALSRKKAATCCNCKKRLKINGINFCEVSGKIILEMHLDSNRSVQCKDVFESVGVS